MMRMRCPHIIEWVEEEAGEKQKWARLCGARADFFTDGSLFCGEHAGNPLLFKDYKWLEPLHELPPPPVVLASTI